MITRFGLAVGLLMFSNVAFGDNYTRGFLYPIKGPQDKWIYVLNDHTIVNKDGTMSSEATFKDQEGKVVLTEKVKYTADGTATDYIFDHSPAGETGRVTVDSDGTHFEYTKEGNKKTNTERVWDDFITGPSLKYYVKKHWDELKSGKEIEGRFAALDRRETIKFLYKKVGTKKVGDVEGFTIEMKIKMPMLRFLVDEIYLTYAENPFRIIESKGRMVVKVFEDGKWKKQDYLVRYEHSEKPFK
ncbi:MAG: hypothetical protein KDD25_01845 [Bdellovibrionales bacterium]|nr:hypothetical protein [Bdellovibrionales bacterium]